MATSATRPSPAGDHQMNAPCRSIALLFALLTAASLAVVVGTAPLSVVSANADVDAAFQQNTSNASVNTSNETVNASITLTNQTREGRSVFVDGATLPEGGFVVLREPGPNGSVVGVSLPLNPGDHEGKVTLRGVPGAELNRTRLGANTTLVATIHRDSNENGRFDGLLAPGTDDPYTENDTPVSDRVRIAVPDEERPTTASVTVTNGTSNGTSATVDSVTLSEGGYVGIHRGGYNESNATESLVGATSYLEPGTYENVTVAVGADVPGRDATALADSGRISAVVYADTDSDREFQYVSSGGVEDQPALANGSPVATAAVLTVDRPRTATPTPTQTPTPLPAETSTQTPTATATQTAAGDQATPYGGESNGRDGILENPLFPLLVLVFAVFAVLAAVGR